MGGIGRSEIPDGSRLCGEIRYRLAGPMIFDSRYGRKDCQKDAATHHTRRGRFDPDLPRFEAMRPH